MTNATVFWRSRFWDEHIATHLRWTGSGHGETNTLAVIGLAPSIRRLALDWRVSCAACGKPMAPIRERQKRRPSDRRTEKSSLYVAVTCDSKTNPGCGRGKAAAEAFASLHRLVP